MPLSLWVALVVYWRGYAEEIGGECVSKYDGGEISLFG